MFKTSNSERVDLYSTNFNYIAIQLVIPLRKTNVSNKKVATAIEEWIQTFQRLLYPLNFEYQISKELIES